MRLMFAELITIVNSFALELIIEAHKQHRTTEISTETAHKNHIHQFQDAFKLII